MNTHRAAYSKLSGLAGSAAFLGLCTCAAPTVTKTAAPPEQASAAATPDPTAVRLHEGNLASLQRIADGPKIDGVEEPLWEQGSWNPIDNLISGKVDGATDSGGAWKGLWTATHLYVFVRVNDDKKLMDSPGHSYKDDQIELFVTSDDRKPSSYFKPRNTNTFAYENPRGGPTTETHKKTSGFRSSYAETATGWTLELAVPFSDWNISPKAGDHLGIDMNINDDDDGGDGGKNDAQTGWNGLTCCVGANPLLQGSAQFIEQRPVAAR